jgi:large subunit ribosomal protein L17
MRHRKIKRKFSRTPAHRGAMLANLVRALFHYEQINTTAAKAKALKALADRLVSRAREDTVHARRLVAPVLRDRNIVRKLFRDIAPAAKGDGGYVRIVRTHGRHGDGAPMAVVELVTKTRLYFDRRKAEEESRKAKKEEARKAAEKAQEAARAAGGAAPAAE